MAVAVAYRRQLAAILLAGLAFRSLAALILPPGYDESYYLFYGQHPALSYFDHPLATGLWSWLGNQLGGSIVALRVPALLSYTLACGLLAEACRPLFGPRAALLTAGMANLSPLLLVCGGLLLLPDAPLLLVAALLAWWLARHPLSRPMGVAGALGLGVILGALTLCKYQSFLVLVSLLAIRLAQSLRSRRWRPGETLLVLLAWLVVSAPLWLWNARHGWVSFAFHSARTSHQVMFHPAGPPLLLISQLLLLFPPIALALLRGLADGGGHDVGPNAAARAEFRQTLRWIVLPQLAFFLLLAGRMQVLQSWLVLAWWLALPLAAARLAPLWRAGNRGLRRTAWVTAAVVPALCLLVVGHIRWGLASALIPPGLDTSNQLVDSAELRLALRRDPVIWKALTEAEVIASNRYELPGFLALALRGHSRAHYTAYGKDPRGFRFWANAIDPNAKRGVMYGFVGGDEPIATMRTPDHFQDLQPLGRVQLQRGGRQAVALEFYSYTPAGEQAGVPTAVEPVPGSRR
ncbi:MAG: glycosyltransferase family 39 protein [Cyanobacteria bacterium]|nr:glycosyltransferase family 39 protein [Cyanobacteriota bacterium]